MGKNKAEKTIEATVKKYKRRMKRTCLCGIAWTLLAIVSLAIGIALLVHFSEYWGDKSTSKRGLAYAGVGFLIFFIISLIVGIILFIIMRIIYVRLEGSGDDGMKTIFKPPTFPPGQAPYPQQPAPPGQVMPAPAASPTAPSGDPNAQPVQPSAPPPGNLSDINVEVADHHKF